MFILFGKKKQKKGMASFDENNGSSDCLELSYCNRDIRTISNNRIV